MRHLRTDTGGKFSRLLDELPAILSVPLTLYVIVALLMGFFRMAGTGEVAALVTKIYSGIAVFSAGSFLLFSRFGMNWREVLGLPAGALVCVPVRVLICALAGAAFPVLSFMIFNFFSWEIFSEFQSAAKATDRIYPAMMVTWFFHSIGEELYFRGFLHNYTKKAFGRPFAIAAISVVFSLAHFPVSLPQFFVTFFVGVGAAVVYERYRSLLYPVVMHTAVNATFQAMVHFRVGSG